MCGIYLTTNGSIDYKTVEYIQNRGRDYCMIQNDTNIKYAVSVLHIRSKVIQPFCQMPLILYNGEIYNNSKSDTEYICNIICSRYKEYIDNDLLDNFGQCNVEIRFDEKTQEEDQSINNDNAIMSDTKELINAPHYDMVPAFYAHDFCKDIEGDNEMSIIICYPDYIVFCKDYIGRKSLGYTMKDGITVSSVNFENEVDPHYIYIYDIKKHCLMRKHRQMPIKLIDTLNTKETVKNCLYESVRRRLHTFTNVVAFSGGIDSLLIVAILHHLIDIDKPIYLINTMFIHKTDSRDRKNGLLAFAELQKLYPGREFVFVKNDIPYNTLENHRRRIEKLAHPKSSVMDFSIAATLFFTAMKASDYSKVLYLGCGADELFGGYKSHLNFENIKERLLFDIENIYDRNCGRDDRVISDNNIEPRYPFLDIDVIQAGLNLENDMYIVYENGKYSNKRVLREILKDLGFTYGSGVNKIAMQFGSGITKYNKFENKLL